MKKVILLVILVILIALVLWWNSRRRHDQHETFSSHNEAIRTGLWHGNDRMSPLTSSFGRRQARNFVATTAQKGVAKADLILSEDGVFLSYSVLVKQNDKPIESMHFAIDDKVVKQISGPRGFSSDDTIVHGLWRRNDATPFTPELAESLKRGELKVEVKFTD
jgi:hypothetical protein